MKHKFQLRENPNPLWHWLSCANCGADIRVSKWEFRRLLKGDRVYIRNFLPPCVKSYTWKGTPDKEETQQTDYMMEWLTAWFAQGPVLFATEEDNNDGG